MNKIVFNEGVKIVSLDGDYTLVTDGDSFDATAKISKRDKTKVLFSSKRVGRDDNSN